MYNQTPTRLPTRISLPGGESLTMLVSSPIRNKAGANKQWPLTHFT